MIPVSLTGRRVTAVLGFSTGFAVSVAISILLTRSGPGVATLWTANAFLVAALLILPSRWGAACAAICGLANVSIHLAVGDRIAPSFVLTALNLAESAAVAWMTRRVCGAALRIDSPKRIGKLIGLAILPPCAVSATLAASYLHLARGRPWTGVWLDWSLAHAAGLAMLLPALLIILRGKQEATFRRSALETRALGILVACAAFVVCGQTVLPLPFAAYAALTVVAFRLGPRGAVLATLLVGAIAIPLLLAGIGPLPANTRLTRGQRLQMTQFFILAAFYAALLTATAVAGQARMRRLFLKRMGVAREARARAIAASAAKTDFLANMSHEIRTPLNGVLAMAEVMDRGDLSGVQRERLTVVRQSGEQLLAVLNGVLDLSKIEAGKLELAEQDFDIDRVSQAISDGFGALATEKGLAFEVDVAAARGAWRGDCDRLRQICANLVSNAIKFTAKGRVVARFEAADAGGLRLSVTDTGIGIAQDKIITVFEKFTQADSSTTRQYGGTGLGLAICRELAQLMGGQISVMSEEGRGSTFIVELPFRRAASASEVDAPQAAADVQSRSVRVLAAEDNLVNQKVLRAIVEPMDVELSLVGDGRAALQAWREGAFDVILMDIQMPVMDGIAAARAIRAEEFSARRPRTPILALTANALVHQVEEYLAAGMDGHVAKPIEITKLYDAISRVLAEPEEAAEAA